MANRAGFTLVELLVALVLGGIITSVLFQLIAGQGRFVERQSAREEVQQNTRASLDLIGSELRTVPGGGGLVLATDNAITVRAVRVWGVVCDLPGGNAIDVAIPTVPGATYSTNSGTGVVANTGTAAAPDWTDEVAVTGIAAASGTCAGSPLAAGSERRSLSLESMPENSAGDPVTLGNTLYLYDEVTYQTGTSAGVDGLWIQRRIGSAPSQPMAGPIREEGGAGLRFEYFEAGSSSPMGTPISPADREDVTRISVLVEAVSRNQLGGSPEAKADTIVVSLRNRL
ncbi:MAG: prepilin-type N-terminal cleavage/methylation domain-containing protein [Gemmatimonadota bacterium]